MLVVISDLHLTDGASGATISPTAFSIFADELQDLALNASKRADGRYRPVDVVDLVLLGDTLDVIRSSRWLSTGPLRPWDDWQRPEYADLVTRITGDILRHNATALDSFRRLALEGVQLPPADAQGRPAWNAAAQTARVRLHYVVGNHDWMLHLPGQRYNALRQMVVEHLGLSQDAGRPLPHDPAEDDALLETLRRHKTFVRHGDVFDPFNFMGDRDASSLGDAVVVELLNRFAAAAQTQLAGELPQATLAGLRELDNVRPLLLIPVWIDGLLERTCPYPSQRKRVKQLWDSLVDDFLSVPFVRQQDSWKPGELVDQMERLLKFSKGVSLKLASAAIVWFNQLRGGEETSYAEHALAEPDFRNRSARHIVYGHTHHAESVPLDASFAEGYTLNQMYFNSGTWRRVHQATRFAPQEREFIAHDVMTYLAFFQGDERGGRPFETWSGTLGLSDRELVEPTENARTAAMSHTQGPHFLSRAAAPQPAAAAPPPASQPAPVVADARSGRGGIVPTRRR